MEPIERRERNAAVLCLPYRLPEKHRFRRLFILSLLSSVSGLHTAFADNWRITPSIGVNENYNTTSQGGTPGQSDAVTTITPSVTVTGSTAHTDINLNYAPAFNHYDFGSNPDELDQNLNASGTIRPFLNFLVIDFSAYATESGGTQNSFVGQQGILVPSNDRVLYYIGKITPHFMAHFRDVATFDAFYRVSSTNTSDQGVANGQATHNSSNSLGQDISAIIGSGASFGTLGSSLNFDHSFNSGTGQNNNASTDSDFLSLQYHLNHEYTLTGSLGYQKTHYDATQGVAGYNNEGMTWNTGVRITPNDVDFITLGYGLQQGAYNPTMQANFSIDQRTTIVASYIVVVQNQLQSTLSNLQYLTYNQVGQAIDSRTGLPFSGVNSIYGTQNALFRDEPFLLTLSEQFQRSGASLTFSYDVHKSLSGAESRDEAWGISISYSRELTPIIRANANFSFTDHVSTGVLVSPTQHAELYSAGFSLTYSLNEHTIITLNDYYFNVISNIPANASFTNQLLIGLRRDF